MTQSPPGLPEAGDRLLSARLAFLYVGWFLVLGIQLPFWPVWLRFKGLDATQIGVLFMIGAIVRALGGPVFANIADRFGRRRALIIALSLASLCAYGFFLLTQGFAQILLVSIFAVTLFSPIMALTDNLTILIARDRGLHYGRIRLWGSLTFVLMATAAGAFLEHRPEGAILWLILAGLAVMVAAAVLGPASGAGSLGTSEAIGLYARIRRLLADGPFFLVLLSAGALQASHAVYYAFGTLYWRELGLADDVIGLLWALGVVAEMVMFALAGGLHGRLGPRRLLMLAGAAGIVRWGLMPMAVSPLAFAALQLLHGFTFAATHLAVILFIARRVPTELSATAQGLYSAVSVGLMIAGSMALSGVLYAAWGGRAYWAMTGFAGAGLILAAIVKQPPPISSPGPQRSEQR